MNLGLQTERFFCCAGCMYFPTANVYQDALLTANFFDELAISKLSVKIMSCLKEIRLHIAIILVLNLLKTLVLN
jgi:hypothetical protein